MTMKHRKVPDSLQPNHKQARYQAEAWTPIIHKILSRTVVLSRSSHFSFVMTMSSVGDASMLSLSP